MKSTTFFSRSPLSFFSILRVKSTTREPSPTLFDESDFFLYPPLIKSHRWKTNIIVQGISLWWYGTVHKKDTKEECTSLRERVEWGRKRWCSCIRRQRRACWGYKSEFLEFCWSLNSNSSNGFLELENHFAGFVIGILLSDCVIVLVLNLINYVGFLSWTNLDLILCE